MDKSVQLKGTAIRESDLKEGKVLSIQWIPRAQYAWDTGVAIGRFLEELKGGKIIGMKCPRCRRIMIPPRMFCELCYQPCREWIYLQDRGTVRSFCISYLRWNASRMKDPFIPSVIELEGATKGMGFFHLTGEIEPQDMKIGLKVKAVWKDAKERIGAITDIRYFKPV
jgi:hypothetical protein